MCSFREIKVIKDSSSDINFLIKMKSSLTPLEFTKQSVIQFSNYLENKKIIPKILDSGNYTYELSIIWKMENEPWFKDSIQYVLLHARNAFEKNQNEFINSIEEYYPTIHESLENYHDTCFLYNQNPDLQNREVVRQYFRVMGDMIESVYYPMLRFVYNMLALSNKSPIYKKVVACSYGKIVTELLNIEHFDFLLKKNLSNIPLNQWRNISQHSSYKYNPEKGIIVCSYGKNSSIHIEMDDLRNLMIQFNILQQWLKISFEFTYLEFMDFIHLDKGNLKVTSESLLSQFGNILPLNGYSLLDVNKILDYWTFKIKDNHNLGIDGFKKSIGLFLPILNGFHFNNINITIELFDNAGKSIQKLYLEK